MMRLTEYRAGDPFMPRPLSIAHSGKQCDSKARGYLCTRERGHKGVHQGAISETQVAAEWT